MSLGLSHSCPTAEALQFRCLPYFCDKGDNLFSTDNGKQKEGIVRCAYTRIRAYRKNSRVVTSVVTESIWSVHMNEKLLERKLTKAAKMMGGLSLKFISPGLDGVPDRIILLPGGHIGFAEIKTTGMKPRPIQMRRKRQLEALGFPVFILDGPEQIGGILDEIRSS